MEQLRQSVRWGEGGVLPQDLREEMGCRCQDWERAEGGEGEMKHSKRSSSMCKIPEASRLYVLEELNKDQCESRWRVKESNVK